MIKLKNIRLAIVEDHQVVRKSLVKMLSDTANYDVVIEASNGHEFLDKLKEVDVDVVLLDIEMPIMNGLQTVRALKKLGSAVKIVMLTMYDDKDIIFEMLSEGIDAYLLKECSIEEMEEAIEKVHNNIVYTNTNMNNAMIQNISTQRQMINRKRYFDLTERDLKIIKLICDGRSSDFISNQLSTSKKNVDLMRTKIMKKLNVKSANELIRSAILQGFYTPRTDKEIEKEYIDEKNASLERRMKKLTENNLKNLK